MTFFALHLLFFTSNKINIQQLHESEDDGDNIKAKTKKGFHFNSALH